jgi:hypothetical protein
VCCLVIQEAYRQQFRGFMSFVDQQRQLPVLKQFLKLYTTISLPKLAGLMDTDEAAVKEQLRVLEVSLFPDANWFSRGRQRFYQYDLKSAPDRQLTMCQRSASHCCNAKLRTCI